VTAVVVFTRRQAAERLLLSLGPTWQLAQFDQQNFVAFLRNQYTGGMRHVLFDPEQTEGPNAVTIQGNLAVIDEYLGKLVRG